MTFAVWREDGKGLVQIGVKPTRLLEEMHNNEISSLAANMPIAEDMTIYIADRNSGTILGSTKERLVNRNLSEIGIDPDSRNIKKSALFTCYVLGEATYCLFQECGDYQIGVTQLCSEVNKEFWNEMLILSAYLGTAAAVLILVIWKATDLIEKEREERLKEQKTQNLRLSDALNHAEVANKAKTTFLFDISHDIRTPMNAILGYTRLAQNHLTDMKSLERYLNNIAVSGEQLLGLINSVLDMSRIESGKVILDEKSYPVYDIIDELHMSVKGEMEKKHISFDMVRDYPDQDIFCDRVKVQEIFLNLLSNAIKYNREGGSIRVTLRQYPVEDGWSSFETIIEDNGIGMSEEFLPHIYDNFERERTKETNGIKGTGLGMSITKRLVDLMNGTIQVESQLGAGTKVTVRIPHRTAKLSQKSDSEPKQNRPVDFSGKRILLAEDNDLNAEIAAEILQEYGFRVERAADGAVCVEMLLQAEPQYYDLILMDVQMPVMDGYTATRTIRALKDEGKAAIPIIAMTANAFEEDRRQALSVGMNEHIGKPIDIDRLLAVLRKVFG